MKNGNWGWWKELGNEERFGEDKRILGMNKRFWEWRKELGKDKKSLEQRRINQNKDEMKLEQQWEELEQGRKDARVEFTMKVVGTTPYFFSISFLKLIKLSYFSKI
jgi:hypothetical protein